MSPRITLDNLYARGFDRSAHTFGRENLISVACSQCQALVVNGVACHEAGCPNQTRECDECGVAIPKRQRLCESCAADEQLIEDLELTACACVLPWAKTPCSNTATIGDPDGYCDECRQALEEGDCDND